MTWCETCSHAPGHPLRVAIYGVTASGKSTCARWLVDAVAAHGRPSMHVTMDGCHHRRAHRYRQGRASALGYYRDAYDFDALRTHVLIRWNRCLPMRSWSWTEHFSIGRRCPTIGTTPSSVDTPMELARARGVARDADALGGTEAAGRAFDQRYHAACRNYLDEVDPRERATRVLPGIDSLLSIE